MRKYPNLKIITISSFGDHDHLRRMVDIGVKGYLLKTADIEEVHTVLETVLAGGTCFGGGIPDSAANS